MKDGISSGAFRGMDPNGEHASLTQEQSAISPAVIILCLTLLGFLQSMMMQQEWISVTVEEMRSFHIL